MIAIAKDRDLVTLINVFSCEPQGQQRLVDSWIRATEERLGALPSKYAKPDAHLYEVCYLLDKTDTLSEVRVDAKR